MGVIRLIVVVSILLVALAVIFNIQLGVSERTLWDKDCLEDVARDVCDNKGGEFNRGFGPAGFSCVVEHEPKVFVFTKLELKLCVT